jgi:signal transduction histidine kinase
MQAPSSESIDLVLLYQQHLAAIANAPDLTELLRRAEAALAMLMPAHRCEIRWCDDDPGPAEPPESRTGSRSVPIQAAGQLLGWLISEADLNGPGPEPALGLLAAVLGPAALALRHASTSLEQRQAVLRPQIERLRAIEALTPLLHELSLLVRKVVPFNNAGITLRYRGSEWLELAYLRMGDDGNALRLYWRGDSGLSSAVMAEGTLITTAAYAEECGRRAMPSFQDMVPRPMHAWIGAPLRDQGAVFGVLFAFSDQPGQPADAVECTLFDWLAAAVSPLVRTAQRHEWAAEEVRQRETLIKIARAINSSLDPETVLSLILERAPALLDAEESSLLLLDEATGELVFHYAAGPAGRRLLGQRLPPGTGIAGHVASSGQAAIVNDIRDDGRFYRALDGDTGFTTRSILAVPLQSRDGVRGVIEVLNRRNDAPFIDADRVLLAALADQAIIALENASRFASLDQALTRRLQDLDQLNARLRTILRAANALRAERPLADLLSQIVGLVSASSGFNNTMVALVRRERTAEPYLEHVAATSPSAGTAPGRGRGLPLSRFEALLRPEFRRGSLIYLVEAAGDQAGWLGSHGGRRPQPALTEHTGDWQPGDTLLCLLRDSRGELLGILAFDGPEDGQRPSAEQVQVLEILANQAAAALENAHLYDAQQQSLNRMLALNGLGRAISTNLRAPRQIYELTARGMQELSDARWAAVFLADLAADKLYLYQAFHTGADPLGEVLSLARDTIAARRPMSRSATRDGSGEAMIAIPLRGSHQVLGAICIGYGEGAPGPAELEILILFASQAATAVESIGLLAAVRQGRDQLASIMDSTREGMLLVDEDGRVAVANGAFVQLAGSAAWAISAPTPGDLAALPMASLVERWQAAAGFTPAEHTQIWSGVTAVATGVEDFGRGQLSGTAPGARSLEWTVLRAARADAEGDADPPDDGSPWPILLTIRDITALKETERLRNDLTNMMVHDLRSPLTSVMTSIDMIFRGITGEVNPTQREILTIAYTSAQHLLNMVNLLLDISRLEGRRMPLDRVTLEASALIEQAIAHMSVIAQSKSITIMRQVAPGARFVFADEELILRVLQNLLDNALKFSPHGRAVLLLVDLAPPDLAAASAGQIVRFAVRDEGIGIKPADREQIFTKFGQAGNRRSAGSGLGLTFCKLVVEAHGGRIWVESEPGFGSTFFITLPAAPDA